MLNIMVVFILSLPIWAQADFRTVVSEQLIEADNERVARSQALEKAGNEAMLDAIKGELGESRALENKAKIESEIQPLKNRFLPFMKILSAKKETLPESGQEGYRFRIELKLSRADLRTILQQKGLFSSGAKTGIALPFIEFNQQLSGESSRWWAPVFTTSRELESFSENFEAELFQGFLDRGLFLLKPQAFKMVHLLPSSLRKTFLTQTEMAQIASTKEGQLFVDGRVDIMASPVRENALRVRVQLSCKQVSNGKSLGEVVRSYDAPAGKKLNQMGQEARQFALETGEDLASQVYELWQRGVLETQTMQLTVLGELSPIQLDKLKDRLQERLGTDSLTERLFEPGRVTFEMDYGGSVEALGKKVSQTQFDGFQSKVVGVEANQVILQVKGL